jgi:molybdenum cofactor cytidylyltransferase
MNDVQIHDPTSEAPQGLHRVRVGCAVLAAAASRHLGRPKQLTPWRGRPLLRHLAIEALHSRVDDVAVIVGAHAHQVSTAVDDLPLRRIVNLDWQEGVGSSIRAAVDWALQTDLDALILMSCDQPLLTGRHIHKLVKAFSRGATIVGSEYGGVVGAPALFAPSLFGDLRELSGNAGVEELLLRHRETVVLAWVDGAVVIESDPEVSMALARADGADAALIERTV